MNNFIFLLFAMMVVTYIPRLIPFLMVSGKELPKNVNKFLKLVPYTALGALIIPSVFSAIPERPVISILGVSMAFFYSWFRGGIIFPVIGSILATFLMISFF